MDFFEEFYKVINFSDDKTVAFLEAWKQNNPKFDVNIQNRFGITPFYVLAVKNMPKAMSFLYENGAKINIKTLDGRTPRDIALSLNNRNAVNLIDSLLNKNEAREHEVVALEPAQAIKNEPEKDLPLNSVEIKKEEYKRRVTLSEIIANLSSEDLFSKKEANDLFQLILEEMKKRNIRTISNSSDNVQYVFKNDEKEIMVFIDKLISIRPKNEFVFKDVFKLDNFLPSIAVQVSDSEQCGKGVFSTVLGISQEIKFESKLNQFLVKEKQKKVFISAQADAVKLDFELEFDMNIFKAMQFAVSDAINILEFKKNITDSEKIKNPGIYTIPRADGKYDIIMKRNEKMNLDERLNVDRAEDIFSINSICFFNLLVKISGIHELFNCVHRDIKPDNLMIRNGEIKIIDFGFFDHVSKETIWSMKGTAVYLPLMDLIVLQKEQVFSKNLEQKVRDMYGLALTALCFLDKEIHNKLMYLSERLSEAIAKIMCDFCNFLRQEKENKYSNNPYAKILIDIILNPYQETHDQNQLITRFLKEDVVLREHAIKHFLAYDDLFLAKKMTEFVEENLTEPRLWPDLSSCVIGKKSIEQTEFLFLALEPSIGKDLQQNSIFSPSSLSRSPSPSSSSSSSNSFSFSPAVP